MRWHCLLQNFFNEKGMKNLQKTGKKICEWFFSTFNLWYKNEKKTKICFVGIAILNNSRNTTIFIQQVQGHATLLNRDSNTGVFLWNFLNFKNSFSYKWLLLTFEYSFLVLVIISFFFKQKINTVSPWSKKIEKS